MCLLAGINAPVAASWFPVWLTLVRPCPVRLWLIPIGTPNIATFFVVAGSSLVVYPAADMPREAVQSGARLVIINEGETPLDRLAHLRFDERIGEVLVPAVARLKELIKVS